MNRFEVVLNQDTILKNNHVKPFEIIEADSFTVEKGAIIFVSSTKAAIDITEGDYPQLTTKFDVKVLYNLNSIIKITKLD